MTQRGQSFYIFAIKKLMMLNLNFDYNVKRTNPQCYYIPRSIGFQHKKNGVCVYLLLKKILTN